MKSCDAFGAWLVKAYGDPATADYDDLVQNNPGHYTDQQRTRIRKSYFSHQEQSIRSLAATTPDPALRAAFDEFADGYSDLAADAAPEGPNYAMPSRSLIMDLCDARMISVPSLVPGSPSHSLRSTASASS